jgi:hypothetical protein
MDEKLYESSVLINFINNIVAVPVSLFASAINTGLFKREREKTKLRGF